MISLDSWCYWKLQACSCTLQVPIKLIVVCLFFCSSLLLFGMVHYYQLTSYSVLVGKTGLNEDTFAYCRGDQTYIVIYVLVCGIQEHL